MTSRLPVLDRLFSPNCAGSLDAAGRNAEQADLAERALASLQRGRGINAPNVQRAENLLERLREGLTSRKDSKLSAGAPDFFS